ncbi:Gfo/Idh/MocA family oxidoreductase [Arthrobacter sp. W4I7]|uniref:Gfo/Idh/MocA family protein n=1 Tax=Arthrobacter sp. W4I7 TaxID=3042296 RepID=UPI002781C675|nr:Gfo/Idh/MocA family oxidoreductase [Arthrobacter sp. W4I7]MDQ0691299.1 putative dehydrogenase [Arthrobacter sp. W4I7]
MRAEAIGRPRSVRASFGIPFPMDVGSRWSAELGGSTLLDQGIYPITLALDVFGAPTEIIARGRMRADGVDLAEHVTLEFADGCYAQLAASMVEFCELTASVNGTKGWIAIPTPFWATHTFRTHASGGEPGSFVEGIETASPVEGNGFGPMIEHVNAALAAGDLESPIHPFRDTLAVFDVLDAIRAELRVSEPT